MADTRKARIRKSKDPKRAKKPWIADYFDQHGKRHQVGFRTRTEASEHLVKVLPEVRDGTHTPTSGSITVAEAARLWLDTCKYKGRSRKTLENYGDTVARYIDPLIGDVKLAKLSKPVVVAFRDKLMDAGKSNHLVDKTLIALKAILEEAASRGLVAQNTARPVRSLGSAARKLGIGVDVPTIEEARLLIHHASATSNSPSGSCSFRPLLITALFSGMRCGELRALTWDNTDFDDRVIRVRQGANKWGEIGRTKTTAAVRDVPMAPIVANTLLEWRAVCPRQDRLSGFWTPEHKVWAIAQLIEADPKMTNAAISKQVGAATVSVARVRKAMPIASAGRLWLVFPSQRGDPMFHSSISMQFRNFQLEIGIVDAAGEPKYSMHACRHFFASWGIQQGWPIKRLSGYLGHKSTQMTWDIYGHLFPDAEGDLDRFAAAEQALLGSPLLQQKTPILQHGVDNPVKRLGK